MITINLLPEEMLASKTKGHKIPVRKVGAGAGILFAVLTVCFYVDFLVASVRLRKLESQWNTLQPQSLGLKKLQGEVEGELKSERDFLKGSVTAEKPLTHLLLWVSEFLPESAWLTELQLDRAGEGGEFLVKGLCLPSKGRSSIEQIETYLHQLKGKMPDAVLSLTTTRQKIEGAELTQFTAHFGWGKKNK